MSQHMPNHRMPGAGEPGWVGLAPMQVPDTAADRLAEALSAWMDGEALPAGVDEAALLQWLLDNEQAQAIWQQWRAHADCLHAQSLPQGLHMAWTVGEAPLRTKWPANLPRHTHSQRHHVARVGSAAWNERLRQQLAQTPAGSDEASALPRAAHRMAHETAHGAAHGTPQSVAASSFPPQTLPARLVDAQPAAQAIAAGASTATTAVTAAAAANDPVWRWKLAAGFASVAAVGMALWSLLGQPPTPGSAFGTNGALLAVQTPGGAASLVAQAQQRHVASLEAPAPVRLASTGSAIALADDPYAEALLQAHSQLGDNLLLQDVSPAEQDEAF